MLYELIEILSICVIFWLIMLVNVLGLWAVCGTVWGFWKDFYNRR